MKLEKLIEKLTKISDSPLKTILDASNSNQKKVIGCVAPYVPEEIVYAADCIPVGLWGGQLEVKKARTYLPPFACSIMQSIMELEVNGEYDKVLSAVIIPASCDTLKCFGQKWKGNCPSIQFVHPQNRRLTCANKFLVSEYRHIIKELEEILQIKITDQKLGDSIILYNEYRKTMRSFTQVAEEHLDVITPSVRHNLIKASYFMDKKEYLVLIKEVIEELRKLPKNQWTGKKVVITGITFEPVELLSILEQYGVAVVADDVAQESRQFRTDVPYANDPIVALAMQWQIHEGCSLAFDPYKSRVKSLVQLVKSKDADGIIIGLMKFCDPEEYDVPIIMEVCEKEEIPLLNIEIDQQANGLEQAKTRIQAFIETM